jgi:AcrR family transcriptional regulator
VAERFAGKGLRAENAEKTRSALITAARELFGARGYADVSAEEIVAQARVTRGALYHHFKDKKDLFRAVGDEVGAELAKRVEDAAMPIAAKGDPWAAILAGMDAFLDACMEGEFHRIVIVDAPAVEGWDEWRQHAEEHELGLIRAGFQMAMDAGALPKQPIDVLASMMFSVLNEGGMLIGRASDRKTARKQVGKTIHKLLDGLRA